MLRKRYSKIKSNHLLNNKINIQNKINYLQNKVNYIESKNKTNNFYSNPYNGFLSTLDNKSEILSKNKNDKINNDIKLEDLLKQIDDDYNKHLNSLQLEIDKNNILDFLNPNIYLDINSQNHSNDKINLNKTKYETKNNGTKNKSKSKNDEIQKINIDVEINNINDLINLIEKYKIETNIEYNIDMKSLHNIKEHLIELNDMIGMNNLKCNIVDQILYFSQNLHKGSSKYDDGDFLHTVIYGPP